MVVGAVAVLQGAALSAPKASTPTLVKLVGSVILVAKAAT